MSAAAPNPMEAILGQLAGGGMGGGGGMMGGMMGGAPQGGPPQQDQGQDIPALLKQALDLLLQAYQAETDPLDKEAIGKAMSVVDQVFSQEQKDKDAAMSGQMNPRMLRRNR